MRKRDHIVISMNHCWGRATLPLWAVNTSPASQEHKEQQCNGSRSLLKRVGTQTVQEFTDAFSEHFHPCTVPMWQVLPL